MRWTGKLIGIVMLCGLAGGCQSPTIQISIETLNRIVCETADFYRFKPYRETWEKLTMEEQAELKDRLRAYRTQNCPAVLGKGT